MYWKAPFSKVMLPAKKGGKQGDVYQNIVKPKENRSCLRQPDGGISPPAGKRLFSVFLLIELRFLTC